MQQHAQLAHLHAARAGDIKHSQGSDYREAWSFLLLLSRFSNVFLSCCAWTLNAVLSRLRFIVCSVMPMVSTGQSSGAASTL